VDLTSNRDLKNVRIFIPHGAPFANKTMNIVGRAYSAGSHARWLGQSLYSAGD